MAGLSPARRLRRDQTPAERRFWEILHPFRQAGGHWRRQAPIGPYIVDFACKRARIVFEIDGDSHFTEAGMRADVARTAYLVERGYRVVRFTNLEVLGNAEGVFAEVSARLRDTPS